MARKHPDLLALEETIPDYAVKALRSRECWLVESLYKRRTEWSVEFPDGSRVWRSDTNVPDMFRHKLRMFNRLDEIVVRKVQRFRSTLKARYCYKSSPLRTPELVRAEIEAELASLRKTVGGKALRALRRGKPLQQWRGSSPHNWFVEGSRGSLLWHSDEDLRYRRLPPLSYFDHGEDSKERIWTPAVGAWIIGRDAGAPYETKYFLRDHLLESPRFS